MVSASIFIQNLATIEKLEEKKPYKIGRRHVHFGGKIQDQDVKVIFPFIIKIKERHRQRLYIISFKEDIKVMIIFSFSVFSLRTIRTKEQMKSKGRRNHHCTIILVAFCLGYFESKSIRSPYMASL